jgi:NTP pyrophosphatase (non-canonical NTP hydrolase)
MHTHALNALIAREKDLKKIYEHYGFEPQKALLIEELLELLHALTRHPVEWDTVVSEFADVLIMISQFVGNHNQDDVAVERTINYEIDRQLKRIAEEG